MLSFISNVFAVPLPLFPFSPPPFFIIPSSFTGRTGVVITMQASGLQPHGNAEMF